MAFSIHERRSRLLISAAVFVIVVLLIFPYLMTSHPPFVVELLLKPGEAIAWTIGKLLSLVGQDPDANHSREATPIDLLIGLCLVAVTVCPYPVATYFLLSLHSRMRPRTRNSDS